MGELKNKDIQWQKKGGLEYVGRLLSAQFFCQSPIALRMKFILKRQCLDANDPLKSPGKTVYSITFQMLLLKLNY